METVFGTRFDDPHAVTADFVVVTRVGGEGTIRVARGTAAGERRE